MNETTENDRLMAAIAYPVPIIAVVILLSQLNKARPFQKFHAVQALVFWIPVLVIDFVVCILGFITIGIGFICLPIVVAVLWLLSFWPAVEAYQGKYMELPVITDFIRRQGWV